MKSHSKISFVYLFFAVVLGILVSYTIAAKNDQKKQEEIIIMIFW